MQCKLCLQEKELIKKSHIIPRQFFHKASDSIAKGFGNVSNGDKVGRLYSKNTKSQQMQSGIHVPNILCKDCEQKLGVFDNYAQSVLLNNNNIEKHEDKGLWKIKNVDYKKLKLFFVSVLWRSQICKHDFFNKVNLTKDLEDELRGMIMGEDPGDESDFSVLLLRYQGKEANHFSVKKWQTSFEGYYFRIGNYTFIINVDAQDFPSSFLQYILTANSPLLIPIIVYKDTKEYEFILNNIGLYKE
jgi:hypothetical protein